MIMEIKKIVAMVEVSCESDLTASAKFFNEFANNIAMHIAATNCCYISRKDIPKAVYENIAESDMEAFCAKNCLLEQQYILDDRMKISDLLISFVYKHKENVKINRFSCYKARREL